MSDEFEAEQNQDTALTIFEPTTFIDIAIKPVTDEQAIILLEETNPDDLDILPTGEVYLTQARYRQRLNKAFKPGGWAMRPLSKPYIKDELAMQEWALYANGQFMAYTVGGAEYKESNQRMNWSDVLETVKSNALMRLCKDLGIASECWNKRFTEQFRKDFCIKVWRESQKKPQWRRLDSEQFYDEKGVANDSPNGYPTIIQKQQPRQATAVAEQPTTNGQTAQAESKPTKGKLTRPMTPEQVKSAADVKSARFTGKPGEKQADYAFSSLNSACGKDDLKRHTVTLFLFGKESSKDLTSGECSFLIDWIGAKQENEYTPDENAVKEIEAIIAEWQRQQGQVDMLEQAEEIPF